MAKIVKMYPTPNTSRQFYNNMENLKTLLYRYGIPKKKSVINKLKEEQRNG